MLSKYTLHTEMTVRVYSTALLAFPFTTQVKGVGGGGGRESVIIKRVTEEKRKRKKKKKKEKTRKNKQAEND